MANSIEMNCFRIKPVHLSYFIIVIKLQTDLYRSYGLTARDLLSCHLMIEAYYKAKSKVLLGLSDGFIVSRVLFILSMIDTECIKQRCQSTVKAENWFNS